jgi:Cu(I)/Ag(I) efflux system membrane protein CusA/SilA
MFNRIIEICMRNRLLVFAAFILITLAGWWALTHTPVDAIPDIGENQVIVFADWPGRSPQDVEDQVVYPLGIAMQGIPDVKYVRSTSMFSFGYINIIFKDKVDFYWARTRVLERLNTAMKDMPEGVIPILGPDATGIGQIFWYTVENGYYCPDHPAARYEKPGKCPEDGKDLVPSRLDLHELRSLQDWTIRYYLAAADGVSEVATVGGYVRQYQVDIDPNLMVAYNVKPAQVFSAIRASNVDVGAKVIEEGGMEFLIRGVGFIKSIEDIENIVVAETDGVPVYVKNLGVVTEGPDFRRGALDKEGIPATGGVVLMRYGDNPLRVIQNVKKKIAEIEPGLSPGVRIVPFYDRTHLINRATDTLKETLVDEIIVATIVILVFLGQFTSSIIISLILPLGILFSFLGMKLIGIPSNIMSMGGIAIAIGVMVDAGIVMTENITRLLQEPHPGESRLEVAIRAAKEVGNPILFAMLIIIVAFIPVFSLTGQAGKLFKPLAYTKTFAMLGAAFVALSLIPALCSVFLSDPTRRRRWWSKALSIPTFPLRKLAEGTTWLVRTIYRPIIKFAVRNTWTKLIVVGIAIAVFAASIPLTPLYKKIGQEFMPPLNEGDLLFMPVLLPGASITQAKEVMAKQDRIMKQFPEVTTVVGKLGRAETATDPAPIGMFETIVGLADPEEWLQRAVRWDNATELVKQVANRLATEGLIGKESIQNIDDSFAMDVSHGVYSRIDRMAVQYHNPNIPASEQESLYRIWLLRLIMEEIVQRTIGSGALGNSTFEKSLHSIAKEMEPSLKHGKLFRKKTRTELINELIEATRLPGVSPIMTQPIRNRIDMLATGIQTPVGIKVFGTDLAEIEKIAVQIEQVLQTLPGALGPYAERIGNKPYIEFHIDRNEAARYGIKIGDIQQIIMTAIGGMNLSTTIEGRERYPIRVRYMRELRDNIEALKRVLVPTPKGAQIPLQQLVNIERHPGPAKVASENTKLFSRVFCDVDVDRVGLVDFVDMAQKALAEKIKPGLPPGYFYSFSGQYEAEIEARNRLIKVVPLCIAMIFLLLYINFRSPSAVLSIFFAIPFAFVGGMWLQWLMQYVPAWMGGGAQIKYSTPVWVGYIALFGVAVEDGIVLIEYLLERVRSGEPVDQAAINAGLLRVRPIIMTTATTVLALLPIMLYEVSTNTGAELMKPIAVPTFGGMITCTITNLILAPVIFSLLYQVEHWFIRRRKGRLEPEPIADGR